MKQQLKMYPGPDLPTTQAALISGQFIERRLREPEKTVIMIVLRTVDEMPVPRCVLPCQTEATVAPGIHRVTFDFYTWMNHSEDDPDQLMRYVATSKAPLAVMFSAEPGHQYEIRIAYARNQERLPWYGGDRLWVPSVVDRRTETPVPLLPAESNQ